MQNKFEGYYFKHQKNDKIAAFIPGRSESGAFIQVITDQKSYHYPFDQTAMETEQAKIRIGKSEFSERGVKIALPNISGEIFYTGITPIQSDIMGIFKYFPMECRHGIISMRHRLRGSLFIEKERYDFDDGTGYIESDSGRSFPEKYIWIQANDLPEEQSFLLSIAKIPFCGFRFEGCICVLMTAGKEYRLATYLGAAARVSDREIVLRQGKLRLRVTILSEGDGHPLASPHLGQMSGIIKEQNNAQIRVQLTSGEKTICDFESKQAGYENHGYQKTNQSKSRDI